MEVTRQLTVCGGRQEKQLFPFGSSGFRVGFGHGRTRSGPGKGIALPRLPERPFRADDPLHLEEQWVPRGSLPEFLRPRWRATAVPQSVPAFHPGNASVGTPLLRRSQRSPLSPARHDLSNPTRVLWSLPSPRRAPPNLTPRPLCLVGCHAVVSRQGEGAATWAGEPGCCSQRGAERGPTSPARGLRQGWIGSPRIPMRGMGGAAAGPPRVTAAWRAGTERKPSP